MKKAANPSYLIFFFLEITLPLPSLLPTRYGDFGSLILESEALPSVWPPGFWIQFSVSLCLLLFWNSVFPVCYWILPVAVLVFVSGSQELGGGLCAARRRPGGATQRRAHGLQSSVSRWQAAAVPGQVTRQIQCGRLDLLQARAARGEHAQQARPAGALSQRTSAAWAELPVSKAGRSAKPSAGSSTSQRIGSTARFPFSAV